MKFSKNINNKEHAPKLIFFNEKKIEKDSVNFWHRKLTLKVRNWHFSITWFRADVDLTKIFFMKKSYFSLKEATIWWKILKCYLMAIYLIFNFNCSFQDLVRESTGSRILQNSGWNVLKCHNWDITAGFSYVRQKLPRGICSLLYDYQNSLEIVPLH